MKLNELNSRVNGIIEAHNGDYAFRIETEEGHIEYRDDDIFPAASLIKIPILMESFRLAEQKLIDLSSKISLHQEGKAGGAGVLHLLSREATVTLADVLMLMITVSDNMAANIMIERTGMDRINALLAEMGCSKTVLGRRLMDFEAVKQGKNNFTSARDVILLLKEIGRGRMLKEESRKAILQILQNQQFRYKLPAYMDEETIMIANKTGELEGVEHDAGIFTLKETKIYAAVLTNNLPDEAEGRQALSLIGKALNDYMLSYQKN
ncbi:serine hydrolase [Fictibacillus terranigra]|uniref:Serine hydrolase n=1 Tax=Fictibacillus terranigra TaxID=3058424 RepID=A0ABT8EBB6_9BACL|nr:serine hydrolase [Fictibacillus sp. CENA-BCM004]MDN4075177.1 serine hydrolase [Fictibacillus sp. CENA-BCM004]